jgi:hypothetical protein
MGAEVISDLIERVKAAETARDALLTSLERELRPLLDAHRQITKLNELIARYRVGGSE